MTLRKSLGAIECRIISPEHYEPLFEFFSSLEKNGDSREFHPHPLTKEEAFSVAHYSGLNSFYALTESGKILGYGMLRGWDEGFIVPSLGIAIHPNERGKGLAKVLMSFLHAAARRRSAGQVRLRVYPENRQAIRLYKNLGYKIVGEEAEQLVCIIDL